jgi:REP element-mobilizing transposase RayT
MSKNISLSKLVELVKKNSSRWIKTKGNNYKNFAWQNGYAGFSVNLSEHDDLKKYIVGQESHHKKTHSKMNIFN